MEARRRAPSVFGVLLIVVVVAVLATVSITVATGDAVDIVASAAGGLADLPLLTLLLAIVSIFTPLVTFGFPNAPLAIASATLIAGRVRTDTTGGFAAALALSATTAFVALVLGGSASYLLATSLLREHAAKLAAASRIYRALDAALARDGAKVSALMRTSLPHAMVNYSCAVSGCSARQFGVGLVGHAPWCVLYSWVGLTIDSIRDLNDPSRGSLGSLRSWLGIAALVITAVVLTFYTQRSLRRRIKEELDLAADAQLSSALDSAATSSSSALDSAATASSSALEEDAPSSSICGSGVD